MNLEEILSAVDKRSYAYEIWRDGYVIHEGSASTLETAKEEALFYEEEGYKSRPQNGPIECKFFVRFPLDV